MRKPSLSKGRWAIAMGVGAVLAVSGCSPLGAGSGQQGSSVEAAKPGAGGAPSSSNGANPEKTTATPTPTKSNYTPPAGSGIDWWPDSTKITTPDGKPLPQDYVPPTVEKPAQNVPRPVMPPEAMEETEAGLQAFLRYHSYAQWYLRQTGDAAYLRAVTSSSCVQCEEQAMIMEELYKNEAWVAGGMEASTVHPGTLAKYKDKIYHASVTVDANGQVIVQRGKVTDWVDPFKDKDSLDVNLTYTNGRWEFLTTSPRDFWAKGGFDAESEQR